MAAEDRAPSLQESGNPNPNNERPELLVKNLTPTERKQFAAYIGAKDIKNGHVVPMNSTKDRTTNNKKKKKSKNNTNSNEQEDDESMKQK